MVRTRRAVLIALTCAVAFACLGTAPAFAVYVLWGNHVGPLTTGNLIRDGDYHGRIDELTGRSTGTAWSSVWVVNSSNVRVSAKGECYYAGCQADIFWIGTRPSGFASVTNGGNASPSYFGAGVWYS